MRNLAGDKDCDTWLRGELAEASIEIVNGERSRGEVPASVTGKLGPLTFTRAWYYWVVNGPVPLVVARYIWDHTPRDFRVRAYGQ